MRIWNRRQKKPIFILWEDLVHLKKNGKMQEMHSSKKEKA